MLKDMSSNKKEKQYKEHLKPLKFLYHNIKNSFKYLGTNCGLQQLLSTLNKFFFHHHLFFLNLFVVDIVH